MSVLDDIKANASQRLAFSYIVTVLNQSDSALPAIRQR